MYPGLRPSGHFPAFLVIGCPQCRCAEAGFAQNAAYRHTEGAHNNTYDIQGVSAKGHAESDHK